MQSIIGLCGNITGTASDSNEVDGIRFGWQVQPGSGWSRLWMQTVGSRAYQQVARCEPGQQWGMSITEFKQGT